MLGGLVFGIGTINVHFYLLSGKHLVAIDELKIFVRGLDKILAI